MSEKGEIHNYFKKHLSVTVIENKDLKFLYREDYRVFFFSYLQSNKFNYSAAAHFQFSKQIRK